MVRLLFFVAALSLTACASPSTGVRGLANDALLDVRIYADELQSYMLKNQVSERDAISEAMASITKKLKDPGSAQFRNVEMRLFEGKPIICGEVNAKNSYGGYTGFTRFVASNYDSTFESSDSQYPAINAAANAGIYAACGH